jgi:hypothetical protein
MKAEWVLKLLKFTHKTEAMPGIKEHFSNEFDTSETLFCTKMMTNVMFEGREINRLPEDYVKYERDETGEIVLDHLGDPTIIARKAVIRIFARDPNNNNAWKPTKWAEMIPVAEKKE